MRGLWAACLLLLVALSTGPDGRTLANPDSHRLQAVSPEAASIRSALVRDLGIFPHEKATERNSGGKAAVLPSPIDVAWYGPRGRSGQLAGGQWPDGAALARPFEARAPPRA